MQFFSEMKMTIQAGNGPQIRTKQYSIVGVSQRITPAVRPIRGETNDDLEPDCYAEGSGVLRSGIRENVGLLVRSR